MQQYPQQYQPPTRKRNLGWLWIVMALIAGIFIGYAAHMPTSPSTTSATMQATSQPTQAATQPAIIPTSASTLAEWKTVQSFSGNGAKKTGIFTVPNDWKLNWQCKPSSFFSGQYNLQVFLYSSDGSLVDLVVNTICESGNTSDITEEHQGGQVYLDINSEAAWSIQVQELK